MPRWSIPCLIVGICWSLPLNSQIEPVEWAPIGAKWWYSYTMGVSDPSLVIQTMESTGDTVILNTICRTLKIDLDLYGDGNLVSQPNRYIYQNGDTIFYYNDVLHKFSVLYNLDASNGDTLLILEPDTFQGDSLFPLRVDNKQYVDSLGLYSYRQTQLAEEPFSSLWYFSGQVIEKLGNIDLYFFPINDRACDGGCPFGLRCYQDKDQTLNFIGGTDCSFITAVQSRPVGSSLEIYPNPASDFLYLKDPASQVSVIEIYNLQGRNIIEEKSDRVDLSRLVDGFYIVVLRSSSGQPFKAFKLKLMKN